jgi:hypothetical protein
MIAYQMVQQKRSNQSVKDLENRRLLQLQQFVKEPILAA